MSNSDESSKSAANVRSFQSGKIVSVDRGTESRVEASASGTAGGPNRNKAGGGREGGPDRGGNGSQGGRGRGGSDRGGSGNGNAGPKGGVPKRAWDRFKEPAALNYLLLASAGLLVYFLAMMMRGNDVGALVAVLIAIPGLLSGWVISPAMFLIITGYLATDTGLSNLLSSLSGGFWRIPRSQGDWQIEGVVIAGATLTYLLGHYRLASLHGAAMPRDPAPRRSLGTGVVHRSPTNIASDEIPTAVISGLGFLVAAGIAWMTLRWSEVVLRADPPIVRSGTLMVVTFVFAVGIVTLILSSAVSYINWIRMSPEEAEVVLRDQAFQELRRETDRLHRWRSWWMAKQRRIALKRTTVGRRRR